MKPNNMKGGTEKMKNKHTLGIFAFSFVAILGLGLVSAHGLGMGVWGPDLTDSEKEYIQEQREAIRSAIENNDYATWEQLTLEQIEHMKSNVNEDRFNQMVEQHEKMSEFKAALQELKDSGDFTREDIENLKEEYGVEGKGFRHGPHKGFKR